MLEIGFLLWIALVVFVIRRVRPLGRDPIKVAVKIAILLVVLYPAIEVIVATLITELIASASLKNDIYKKHAPVERILLLGSRKSCDMDCLSLLSQGYREVELQLADTDLETAEGSAEYFVDRPGLYNVRLATRSDPRCREYLAWAALLPKEGTDRPFEFDLAADRLLADDGQCILAERRNSIQSVVAVGSVTTVRETFLGQLRERRTTVFDLEPSGDGLRVIAENRDAFLEPAWPICWALWQYGGAFNHLGEYPMPITELVPPL